MSIIGPQNPLEVDLPLLNDIVKLSTSPCINTCMNALGITPETAEERFNAQQKIDKKYLYKHSIVVDESTLCLNKLRLKKYTPDQNAIIAMELNLKDNNIQREYNKKIFLFILSKIQPLITDYDTLNRDIIVIRYKELVELKLYSENRTAKKGIKRAMSTIDTIKIYYKVPHHKTSIEKCRTIITGYDIGRSEITIYLNKHMNWRDICNYAMELPQIYFSLPPKASDLLYHIMTLIHMRRNEIKENGYFKLAIPKIATYLNLKDPDNVTRDFNKLIREPIEQALTDIEDNSKSKITFEYENDTPNKHEWLNSSIKVYYND